MAKHCEICGKTPVVGRTLSHAHNVRPRRFDYRFTDLATWRATGDWWTRSELGPYCPPLTLRAIPAGSHVLRLELDGYRRWTSAVRVAAGAPVPAGARPLHHVPTHAQPRSIVRRRRRPRG